jgi:acetyl-CoA carboxylase biotin carboxyl carrier protein
MDIKEVKDLILDVLQSDISEFELEHLGTRIRLRRGFQSDAAHVSPNPPLHQSASQGFPQSVIAESPSRETESTSDEEEAALHMVTSPIVGTFYSSPNPKSEPYVKLGDQVHEGSIICLVEAMKLMNEIPSDAEGEIVRIYVENGHPVEYGQKLFAIRPRSQT